MCALSIAATLALSGLVWAWALQSDGAVLDARTAARIFGWLCVLAVALVLFFLVRRRSPFDQPSKALAAALATTLVTGAGSLYLSYFEWSPAAISVTAAGLTASTQAREVDPPPLPIPASLPRTARRQATTAKETRSAAVGTSAPAAHTSAAAPCSGLKGLALHQCLRCPRENGLSGFICHENARAEYCAGHDGSEPGCPWLRPAAMTD